MRKRLVGIFALFLVFVVTISACGNNTATTATSSTDEGKYTAGTYKGSGEGKNGPIEVEVKVSKDKIESIKVVKEEETEGVSDKALKEIPEAIVKNQSLGVDTVSGASATNEGVLAAITTALKKAGGDVEALKKVAVKKEQTHKVVEETSDVIVIGGGASGMSAALRADELGLKTILFEKMSYLGGAISISGGNQVVMGSKLQKEAGVKNDSVSSMVSDFKKNGANKNVDELLQLYAKNVGSTTDWLHEKVGIQYEPDLHQLAEYSHDRELAYTGGGQGFAKTARKAIDKSNINVHLDTRVTKLNVDKEGRITGIEAKSENGVTFKVKAKAIILGTGGYGNNKDLLTDDLEKVLYYGPASSTGDGLLLTEDKNINADRRLMEYGKTYPNGVEVAKGTAKSTIAGNIIVFKENALLLNIKGKRVVNEKASNRQILDTELSQSKKMLYLFMDQAAFDQFKPAVAEAGISEKDINGWLKNNGKTTPYFYHGDTLEELAENAGMDKKTLTNTVKRYNHFVKDGKDKDFDRPAEFLKKEIGKGPYYLVEQKPRFATTMGGLVINDQLQVLNKDKKVISGLYAAGEVVGGVMGDDSPSGANNAWALTSGKLAAESIGKEYFNKK